MNSRLISAVELCQGWWKIQDFLIELRPDAVQTLCFENKTIDKDEKDLSSSLPPAWAGSRRSDGVEFVLYLVSPELELLYLSWALISDNFNWQIPIENSSISFQTDVLRKYTNPQSHWKKYLAPSGTKFLSWNFCTKEFYSNMFLKTYKYKQQLPTFIARTREVNGSTC